MSRDRLARPGRVRQSGAPQRPAIITEAEPSPAQQLRSREKRYAILMGIRVLCLLGAVAVYRIWLPLVFIFLAGLVLLPWMAVLIANDRPPIKPSMYRRFRGSPGVDRSLEARPHRVIDQ